jgi:hypothetical protein
MNEVSSIQVENEKLAVTHETSGLRRVVRVVGLAIAWTFTSAMIVGSLAAATWTVIPTDLLAWGAAGLNRMGYVSHCSYAPISTVVLIVVTGIGAGLALRLPSGLHIGRTIFGGTAGGLIFGALMGIDIVMYIGMGIGLGVGLVFGLLFELMSKTSRDAEARV